MSENGQLRDAVDPRIIFAAERTLLAWIRTGLSLVGLGFVVARFGLFLRQMVLGSNKPTSPISLWLGVALVLLGVVVNGVAVRQHLRTTRRLMGGATEFPPEVSTGTWIAAALCVLGVIVAIYLLHLSG